MLLLPLMTMKYPTCYHVTLMTIKYLTSCYHVTLATDDHKTIQLSPESYENLLSPHWHPDCLTIFNACWHRHCYLTNRKVMTELPGVPVIL